MHSWLSVLPLDDHGFSLHKGGLQDAITLLYSWQLPNTTTKCNCGAVFSTDHAMIYPMGGFPTIRHNELRDITASLPSDVCHNVATEPRLQPLSGESMTHRTAITTDEACLDIRARGFWTAAQDVIFDVRVFHPNAPSNTIIVTYRKHENIKKRAFMASVFVTLSMVSSLCLFSQQLGGWDRRYVLFTKDWRICFRGNSRSHTLLSSVG